MKACACMLVFAFHCQGEHMLNFQPFFCPDEALIFFNFSKWGLCAHYNMVSKNQWKLVSE